ncbi:MAG TPA: GNAT family N-acetyltransferase [Candidatus Acidoferrum sp.]|nr:GNAT family N-acetyltransferase [Candidatus Acidoferrum sp.]
MRAQLIPLSEVDASTVGEWRALSARATEPNPWFEPHVVLALADIRQDMALLTVRGRDRIRLCLPLIPATQRWRRVPLPMWMTPHPLGTPLVDTDDTESVLRCAFTSLAQARGPRFLKLQEVAAEGAVTTAITAALGTGWRSTTAPPRGIWPVMRRRPQCTYLEESVSRKQRHNLRRMRRRLEEQLDDELTLTSCATDEATVDRFIRLEASGWKGREGTALACQPGWADYFHKVCRGFDGEGRLHIVSLGSKSTMVAMKVMVTAGQGLFELRVAYDETFARLSPGTLLEVEAIEHFHRGPHAWVISNTNHGTSPLLKVWPDRCAMISILAECPGAAKQAVSVLLSRLGVRGR